MKAGQGVQDDVDDVAIGRRQHLVGETERARVHDLVDAERF